MLHGVLVVLVVVVASGRAATDSRDSGPEPGLIGSADRGRAGGVAVTIAAPPAGPSLDPAEGARYAGRYRRPTPIQGSAVLQLELVNDGHTEPHWALTLFGGQGPVEKLTWVARDTFAFQLAPRQRVVFRRLGDSVTAISVRRGRDTTWAERIAAEPPPPH